MGWGVAPHEGFADGRRVDGTWNGGTYRGAEGIYDDPGALQAVCGCGWRSDTVRELGDPPDRDQAGEREAWSRRREQAEEACREDWQAEHYLPLLGYEPHTLLIAGRTEGGPRHFLDGRPVHAGEALELLLAGGVWVTVRYEWSFDRERLPTGHLALGGPAAAEELHDVPDMTFDLPPRAVLRWPTTGGSR